MAADQAETVLFRCLSTDAAIRAQTGKRDTRIFPDFKPADAKAPSVSFTRTDTSPFNTIHGHSLGNDVSLALDIAHDKSREAAEAFANQVVRVLLKSGFILDSRSSQVDDDAKTFLVLITVRYFECVD